MLDKKYVSEKLTPLPEEQTFRILSELCPHNKGWKFIGGFDDGAKEMWACSACAEYHIFDRYGELVSIKEFISVK